MTREHRQYLFWQTVIGAAINLLLNAAIGYLVYRGLSYLPLFGSPSIAGDFMVTAFVLPLLVGLIVTPLVRADARNGKVAPVLPQGVLPRLVPRVLVLRGALFGLLGAATVGAVTIWVLNGLGVGGMAIRSFVTAKAVFGGLLAALTTPVVAWRALMDPMIAPARANSVPPERV